MSSGALVFADDYYQSLRPPNCGPVNRTNSTPIKNAMTVSPFCLSLAHLRSAGGKLLCSGVRSDPGVSPLTLRASDRLRTLQLGGAEV